MNSLITIIVPVYNVEKYLSKCLDSIICQTYKNLQIILIDDGSTDNSALICDEYAIKDDRIEVIHKKNGGLSSARNAGLDIARGDYISFVDSDDYIANDMIETAYNAVIAEKADLCIFGIKWIYEDGKTYDKVSYSPIIDEMLNKNQAFHKLCLDGYFYYVTAVNKLYKKSIFNNFRFPVGKLHEDEFTVHYIFNACEKIVSIKNELYFYIQRENSIMHSQVSIKRLDGAYAFLDRSRFFKEKRLKDESFYAYRQACSVVLTCLQACNFHKNKKTLKNAVKAVSKTNRFNLRTIRLKIFYHLKSLRNSLSLIKFKLYELFVLKNKRDNAIILLATPQHGNLGDQAIVSAEYRILSDIFPNKKIYEVPNGYYLKYADIVKKYLNGNDIIVIDGGGNLGSLWGNEDDKISKIISDYKNNKIVIFPQTCFYEENSERRIQRNRLIYESARDLTVTLRERRSYDLFRELFPNTKSELIPDIVLSLKPQVSKRRNGVLICFRSDREKVVSENVKNDIVKYLTKNKIWFKETSTIVDKKVGKYNREKELKKKFKEFASSQLIITDRLHAMIFSAITDTPCIAIDNSSKKVSGVYEWIKDDKNVTYLSDTSKIVENVSRMLSKSATKYDFDYPIDKIKGIFNDKV